MNIVLFNIIPLLRLLRFGEWGTLDVGIINCKKKKYSK